MFPARRRHLLALLSSALFVLAPGAASAAEIHSEAFPGGEVTVSANDGYTEGMLESLSFAFDGCGTQEYEASCTWEVSAGLGTDPAKRCNPATPTSQTVWTSGPQEGNHTVTAPSLPFPLEGCPGQVFAVYYSYLKTFDPPPGGGWSLIKDGSGATLALIVFGPTSVENATPLSPSANPAFQPDFTPRSFGVGRDCRGVLLDSTRYTLVFAQMGCHRATEVARTRYLSGRAPRLCRNLSAGGVRCWRRHRPGKFVEWHLPRSR